MKKKDKKNKSLQSTASKTTHYTEYAMYRKVVLLLRSTNHTVRQQIIDLLEEYGSSTVTDLYIRLRMEQSVVSQHLAILRRAGVVDTERKGKFIYYSNNIERQALVGQNENLRNVVRVLAHVLRLQILTFISENEPVNVNKIYGTLKLEQSITSQHLKVLRNARLVATEREGKHIFYTTVNITKLYSELTTFVKEMSR